MRIDVNDELGRRILDSINEYESIAGQLRRVNRRLDRIEGHEVQEAIDVAALTEKVLAGTAIDESIKTLVVGIADELATHSDPAVRALADKLKEQGDALAAAVQANLP